MGKLTPPKAEAFFWKVLHKRVPTKVELVKRKILPQSEVKCPLCEMEAESVNHLFCSCPIVWRLLQKWFSLWGLSGVIPGDTQSLFEFWIFGVINQRFKEVWFIAFAAYVWTVWTFRNDVVFKGKLVDENQFFDSFISCLGRWCKFKWPHCLNSTEDILQNVRIVPDNFVGRIAELKSSWVPPSVGELKFNIDGAMNGGFGKAGIGGLLRGCDGRSLIMFSIHIGFVDATTAELLALREAAKLLKDSTRLVKMKVTLETDCNNVAAWLNLPHNAPCVFKPILTEVSNFLAGAEWEIRVISRDANKTADKLAKAGISRLSPLCWFSDSLCGKES